jgi:tetratricopeptide (TPR) repeat protein
MEPQMNADERRDSRSTKAVRRFVAVSLAVGALIGLGPVGCGPTAAERAGTTARQEYLAGRFDQAAVALKDQAKKTDENFALQNARLGSVYVANQQLDLAESAFLNAYEVMNSLGTNDGGRSLGAVLVDEKVRVWKGEPFERAYVSSYLGMVYYLRGEYDNARGAFENALFKLRDYDEKKDDKSAKTNESNFALATIMLGRCWQKLGRDDLANPCFAKAGQLQPYLQALSDPELHRRSNVLILADYGYGPERETEFDGSALAFKPSPAMVGPIPQPRVFINGAAYDLRGTDAPPVDLLALAQDRKWQSIDTIRVTKSAVGTGLLGAGAVMGAKGAFEEGSRQRTDLMVAAGLLAAGALLKATSQADVREWGLLPRTTFVLPLSLPPGDYQLELQMSDGTRALIRNLHIEPNRERALYVRLLRWNTATLDFTGR